MAFSLKTWFKPIVGVVAVALVGVLAWGLMPTSATGESTVGFVDQDLVIDAYAGDQIAAVIRERDALQEKFDQESVEMSDEEKRNLFLKYEAELQAFEESIGIRQLMDDIDNAFRESAEAHGVTVILDQGAVVMGGVDLTRDIQERLGLVSGE